MEKKNPDEVQILQNKFNNIDSEFVQQPPLTTSAKLLSPFYAMFTTSMNEEGQKLIAIKTLQGISLVRFNNIDFHNHERLVYNDIPLESTHISYLTFKNEFYSQNNPPTMVLGYRSGLIAHVNCKSKLLSLYNYDEKNKMAGFSHKNQPVSIIATVPDTNGDEVLVLFADSTVMKYQLNITTTSIQFIEKLKRLEEKISFTEQLNRFKHKQKNKNNILYGSNLNSSAPEFSFFFAYNEGFPKGNPRNYFKFNHRTITDMVVKKHTSFTKTIFRDSKTPEVTVFAFVSLDGYLMIYNYNKMVPRLSFKSIFGGFNSIAFSENCELIALGGQDDCITILDLYSLKTLRCEGHKSFVSRAIFQNIPYKLPLNNNSSRIAEGNQENSYVRIIGGGMDACLSFWEFDTKLIRQETAPVLEEKNLPIRMKLSTSSDCIKIEPLVMNTVKDGIAWVEIVGNLLFQSDYDGAISIYTIQNLSLHKNSNNNVLPPLKRRKPEDGTTLSESTADKTLNSRTSIQKDDTRSKEDESGSSTRPMKDSSLRSMNSSKPGAPVSSLSNSLLDRGKDSISRKKNEY